MMSYLNKRNPFMSIHLFPSLLLCPQGQQTGDKPFQGLAILLKVNLRIPETLTVSGSPAKSEASRKPEPKALSPLTPPRC